MQSNSIILTIKLVHSDFILPLNLIQITNVYQLVEKLSVKAPDGPTKVKILTAIAEEHNIKWEPNWFKEEDAAPSVYMPVRLNRFLYSLMHFVC